MKLLLLMIQASVISIGISIIPALLLIVTVEAIISKFYPDCFQENDDDYDLPEYYEPKKITVKNEKTKELLNNQDKINKFIAKTLDGSNSKSMEQNEDIKEIKIDCKLEISNII